MPFVFKNKTILDTLFVDSVQKKKESFDKFINKLSKSEHNQNMCVLMCNIDFMDRNIPINIKYNTLEEAFRSLKMDDYTLKVELYCGYLKVATFASKCPIMYEIHLLNNKGKILQNGQLNKPCYFKPIRTELF